MEVHILRIYLFVHDCLFSKELSCLRLILRSFITSTFAYCCSVVGADAISSKCANSLLEVLQLYKQTPAWVHLAHTARTTTSEFCSHCRLQPQQNGAVGHDQATGKEAPFIGGDDDKQCELKLRFIELTV